MLGVFFVQLLTANLTKKIDYICKSAIDVLKLSFKSLVADEAEDICFREGNVKRELKSSE